MASPMSLQACVSHQIVALQTLRFLLQWRNWGQTPPRHVSAASGQAGRAEQPQKGEGQTASKLGGKGNAALQPQDPLACVEVRTILARVVQTTSQLVQVEQTILNPLHQELNFPVYLKDSIEFRNICCHMAQQQEGQAFDQDLSDTYQCLKTIIKKLIHSLLSLPADVRALSCIALRQVLQNHLDL